MSGIQITPSGIGQSMMIAGAILGGVMAVDAILFMTNEPSVLEKLNVWTMLNDKVRGVVELGLGIMLVMFGLGLWTVQVGGIAIISLIVITNGTHWAYKDSKGTASQQTTTVSTPQQRASTQPASNASTRYYCPLNKLQNDWCDEDHDNDGTKNRFDDYFNKRGQGIRNCRFGNYVSQHNGPGCKPIK